MTFSYFKQNWWSADSLGSDRFDASIHVYSWLFLDKSPETKLYATSRQDNARIEDRDSICMQPKEVGPCRASIQRFYFDSNTKTCVEFSFGGCNGNGNNFDSIEQCSESCISKYFWHILEFWQTINWCKSQFWSLHFEILTLTNKAIQS